MPIVKIADALVYFAHVPKCGGAAVEYYLQERFGPLAFLDRGFLRPLPQQRWNRSSPQHIDRLTLGLLFPAGFFSASFTVVRHPVDRIKSVFRYQRDVVKELGAGVVFSDWLQSLPEITETRPYFLDNHVRAMDDIVPAASKVFRLEDGMEPVIGWLDQLADNTAGPREIKVQNTYEQRLKGQAPQGGAVEPTEADRALIAEMYSRDFTRFGYQATGPEGGAGGS